MLFGVLGLSIVWYYFPKYGAYAWFKGPVANVEPEAEEIEEEILSRSPTITLPSEAVLNPLLVDTDDMWTDPEH